MWRLVLLSSILSLLSAAEAEAKMRLAWQSSDINLQAAYALGTDAFKAAGLEAEMKPFASGPAMLPALAAKEVDVAILGDFPAVTGFANGLPINIILLNNVTTSHTRIVATPASGIKKLADLKGRKIGVSLGTTGHGNILKALSLVGLTQQDVTLVNVAPANIPAAYFANQIDAAVAWEPHVGAMEKAGAVRIATSQEIGVINASTLVARTDYIRDNPGEIAKLMKIWGDASTAFRSDRAKFLEYTAKRQNMSMDELNPLIDRMGMILPTYQEQLSQELLGGRFYGQVQETARLLLELKRIEVMPPNLDRLIDVGPMRRLVGN